MTSSRITIVALTVTSLAAIVACNSDNGASTSSAPDTAPQSAAAPSKPIPRVDGVESPGKITAPVSISYQVVGNPVVGQPVAVNLQIASTGVDQPITLRYRVNDASSMVFPDVQASMVRLSRGRSDGQPPQQVTVVPQREGRLYLNVSAEIETANGTMFKSIAVPIQVGSAPAVVPRNGEVLETAEGEQVISMPAEESQ